MDPATKRPLKDHIIPALRSFEILHRDIPADTERAVRPTIRDGKSYCYAPRVRFLFS